MNELLSEQNHLKSRMKSGVILIALGVLGGLLFVPFVLVSVYGLYRYWSAGWKVMRSKCPECGAKVGYLQPVINYQCRNCKTVFIEPPKTEGGKHQDQWFK